MLTTLRRLVKYERAHRDTATTPSGPRPPGRAGHGETSTLREEPLVSMRTVGDLMTSPAVTAGPDETLAAAATRMREAGVGSVVVGRFGQPVGILTERDLVMATAAGADPDTAPVRDWMTAEADWEPDVAVEEAWASLASHGYRHIPVVSADELKGVVSMRDLLGVAQIRPVSGAYTDAPKGLEGVVAAETSVGDVRGLEGFYHYRQYSALDVAATRSLEDAWRLLFDGELPDAAEAAAFAAELAPLRKLPEAVAAVLPAIAASGAAPLDGLRSALSLVAGAEHMRASLDLDRRALRVDALRLSAVVPTIVASLHRLGQGLEPLAPREDLGHAANYLYMLSGEEPDPALVRPLEQYMILTIDHGLNASTFTARVITSTGADVGSAVVGAVGALSGPLHGGAPSRALDTIDAIGTAERAEAWVRDAVSRGEKIMGFGHRVYRTDDPRSTMMREIARGLGSPLQPLAEHIEATVLRVLEEMKPGHQLRTNVEFYAGVVMDRCGLPRQLFTPTFAASRCIGWCAHILEQAADNRIIRPSARYVGPPPPQPVPPL